MTYIPVHAHKIYEQIAMQIEQRILSGELREGDRLPTERELANQFQASRTAVREAMKTLAQKGLVDMRPGRGTIVIDGTSQAMRHSLGLMMRVGQPNKTVDLVEVREILEPEIAALAAARAQPEQILTMQAAVEVMDVSLNDADAFIAADNDFHRALAKATQNELILALLDSVVDLLSAQRKQIFAVAGGPERGQVHHKLLLAAVMRKDPEAARKAMQAHLKQVRDDVVAGTRFIAPRAAHSLE
ncbi:MAG TPA: FadR/GntR family transcriptional regulator [Ktedonobacteraceae bacterium]|nr:FadR/GntR family transcriptional regulator [Ktedonobacteraceae bacterium]